MDAGLAKPYIFTGWVEGEEKDKNKIGSRLQKLQLISIHKESSTVIYSEILSNGKFGYLNLGYSTIVYISK